MHSYTLRRFIQRKTIAAWAISMSVLIFIFAALSPLAHAQCFFDDIQTYTCSDDAGTITLVGTGGSNIFRFLNGVIGQITVVSGGGSDTVDFLSYTTGVIVNLSSTSPQTVAGGLTILFSGFNTAGQSYTVNGGAGNDIIHGGFGTDTINGNAGNDSLSGGWFDNPSGYQNDNSGNDTIYGGDGNDFIFGGHGNDTLYGDAGDDDLHGFDGVDVVSGGDGNDILHGNNGVDIVMGGPGDDVLTGGVEIDTLDGGDGTDTISDTYDGCLGDIQISIENHQVCEPPEPPEPPTPPTPDPAAPTLLTPDLCITERTRVALVDGTLLVFSDFTNTANGMSISHIPLRSLRALSDEEKASGVPVPLLYKDSEFAPGWSVGLYWQNSHYGFVIYKDGGKTIYDDTDAICGWF